MLPGQFWLGSSFGGSRKDCFLDAALNCVRNMLGCTPYYVPTRGNEWVEASILFRVVCLTHLCERQTLSREHKGCFCAMIGMTSMRMLWVRY